jgi:hypothetical protein
LLRNAKDRAPVRTTSTSKINSTAEEGKRRSRSLKSSAKNAVRDDNLKAKAKTKG